MIASLLVVLGLAGVTGAGERKPFACESAAEVQAALAPLLASPDMRQNEKQRTAARAQLFAALRARFPGDIFVEADRIEFEKPEGPGEREAFAAPYRARAEANPSDPVAAYLAGMALAEWKTQEAIGFLRRAVDLAPALPQAHQALADILAQPSFRDDKRAQQHRQRAFALCPLMGLDFVQELTPRQRRQLQDLLAARLNGDTGRYLGYYPRYWELLFQQARPRGYPQVRERIRAQLQAIQRLDSGAHPYRSSALIEGWKLVGDRAQIRRAEDELLHQAPHSERAQAVFANRWEAEHPTPAKRAAEATRQQHQARLLSDSAGWVRSWPSSSWAWQQRVQAVFADEVRAPGQEIATIEGALQAAHDNPEDVSWEWPLPLVLAERLTARGQYLDRVPGAVAAGLSIVEDYLADRSDYYPRNPEMEQIRRAQVMWPVWTLVAEAAVKRKHAADAARAVEQLSAILAPLKPPEDWRENRAELAEARARLALVQDRNGDALAFLQQSVSERIAGKLGPLDDDLQAVAERLMRAQGASEAAVKQWRETTAAAAQARPQAPPSWKAQSRRLPDFRLDALDGNVWSLSGLRGKVVFVNIWSRGCGPCLQEMPALNQLHRRLAGRRDAVMLSINIDEDMGRLPLFLSDVGAEFPVLLGNRWVNKVLPEIAIPRNWVIDGRGVLRVEQVGYAPDAPKEAWLESVLREIDKAAS